MMSADLLTRMHRWWRRAPHRVADVPAAPGGESTAIASPDDAVLRASLIVPRLIAEPWYVDAVTVDGSRVTAAGWSLPVEGDVERDGGAFTINGRPFDAIRYPLHRQDVGDAFWQRAGAAYSGFECSIEHVDVPYPDGLLEIARVRPDTPAIERGRDVWFRPDPARHQDLPDADRRFRVIGDRDATGFLVSGATDFQRLDRLVQAVAGRRIDAFARVLDWGVGCGRVARHWSAAQARAALTGCDIDHDNVAWCNLHLPGTFVCSQLTPPLPFPAEAFDVVYGISVFTHLREAMQMRWLEELARVTAPGALLLMTIHGETAIDFSRLSPAAYARTRDDVRRQGIVVSGSNTQLDGHAENAGEYVNVYHSADYVRRTWGRYFDVLHIVPGYILHHDLVVLRKA